MFVVGLSLSGVFTIGGSISGIGSNLADKSGYTGSFFTGVLATIVATPCTAPFMAAAVGYALTQPAFRLLAIFLSLGFGLALPYVLLTSWPALQKILPRPGVWMERAKQVLAFPMYATTVWLVWVLAQQAGANAVAVALGGMVLISFAAWLYDVTRHTSDFGQRSGFGIASLSLITALIGGYTGLKSSSADANASKINGAIATKHREVYTPERLELLLEEGKPVFLNFTASWCISCLVNERVALSNGKVIDAFTHSGITYLKGDWTNRDAHISQILSRFGRSGVPLYVYYPAGGKKKPIELPQILTPEIVLSAIKNDSSISSN
jgi:thiol:disulfide interchange protein DsbD